VQKLTLLNGDYTCYAYDDLNRLTSATTKDSSGTQLRRYQYDFDAASNRTQKTYTGGSGDDTITSYAYNAVNELCWSASGSHTSECSSPPSNAVDYDFDASGNEVSQQNGRQSSYDIRNRLTAASGAALQYLSPTNDELVGYGSSDLRNNLLGVSAYGDEAYVRSPDGMLLAQHDATSTQYVIHDRLGSTIGLIDGSSVSRTYTYDPDGSDRQRSRHRDPLRRRHPARRAVSFRRPLLRPTTRTVDPTGSG
jgi:hypothetical protein